MNINIHDTYIICDNKRYPIKPILKVGVGLMLYRCFLYWEGKGAPKEEQEKHFGSGTDGLLNFKNYEKYVRDFKSSHKKWQDDFEENKYNKNTGARDETISPTYNLYCTLNLQFQYQDSSVHQENISAHPSIKEKKEIIVKEAIHFLKGEVIIQFDSDDSLKSTGQSQPEYSVLVLGTHDDISYLEEDIRNYLQNELEHKIKTIDYITQDMQEASGDDIHDFLYDHICTTRYNLYFIIVGRHYGQQFEFERLEKFPRSRRHLELELAHNVCEEPPSPIYILKPKPDSPFYNVLEGKLDKLLARQGILSDKEKREAKEKNNAGLNEMGPLIKLTGLLEMGGVLEINHDNMLFDQMKSCIDTLNTAESMCSMQPFIPSARAISKKSISTSSIGEKIELIYEDFKLNPKNKSIPGFCVLVHGRTQRHLNSLVKSIAENNYWDVDKMCRYTFKEDNFREIIFWQALFKKLHVNFDVFSKNHEHIDKLAETIIEQQKPYRIILIDGHRSGLSPKAFLEQVWQPLYRSIDRTLSGSGYKPKSPPIHLLVSWRSHDFDQRLFVEDVAKAAKYDRFVGLPLEPSI